MVVPVWFPLIEATKLADSAVHTRIIAGRAVTTAKIDELAVTNAEIANATITKLQIGDQEVDIQRMLDPVDWTMDDGLSQNATLDTTKRHQLDVSVSIPSWAGEVLIFGTGSIQVTNAASDYNLAVSILVDDASTPSGGTTTSILGGYTMTGYEQFAHVITAPGSTVEVRLWGWLSAGTNSANAWALKMGVLFKR